jgi:hypothetical protein
MDKNLLCIVLIVFAGCSSPQEGAQTPASETYAQEEATPEPTPEPEPQPEPQPEARPEPPKTQESSLAEEIERARRHVPRSLPSRHK